MLNKLEDEIKKSPGGSRAYNAIWLIFYHLFKYTSSERAQTEYEAEHRHRHNNVSARI